MTVWLYRGEVDKYKGLIQEYKDAISEYMTDSTDEELDDILCYYDSFESLVHSLKEHISEKRKYAKECVEKAESRQKKAEQAKWDEYLVWLNEILTTAKEANWLYSKFGEGKYEDVLGLCKIAEITKSEDADSDAISIEEKGWSLTPGAYVGVAPVEDDGIDFEERMTEIHNELLSLQAESNDLMGTISQNMKEMGL